jgi:hypothetical protein
MCRDSTLGRRKRPDHYARSFLELLRTADHAAGAATDQGRRLERGVHHALDLGGRGKMRR